MVPVTKIKGMSNLRFLRSFKNRYGSVNELGLFRMTQAGLEEVKDKNKIFLNPFMSAAPGNAVSAAIEGSRTILFEVQALVTFSSFSNPRRLSDGFDLNRLIIICAVLEKHAGLKLGNFDVFINVSGGFNINETAGDLAVAVPGQPGRRPERNQRRPDHGRCFHGGVRRHGAALCVAAAGRL